MRGGGGGGGMMRLRWTPFLTLRSAEGSMSGVDGVHRDNPLVVKQAYSCEQDQRYRLSADFFDELQFHVLYNFKYE